MTRTRAGVSRRQHGPAAMFLAPFYLMFLVCLIAPLSYAAWLSLYHEESTGLGFGGTTSVFVGLDNFRAALADLSFWKSFRIPLLYCLMYVPVMLGTAVVLALLLDSAYARAKRFFQLALYAPHVIPGVIATVIWVYLYTPGISPVIDAFETVGLPWTLGTDPAAVAAIANITVWMGTGYSAVIFFASLQAIPRELIEAATIDGAGAVRTALSVKVPLIRGAIGMVAVFSVIGSFQMFAGPLLLQGQTRTITSEWTPVLFIYNRAFLQKDFGYAAATSLVFAAAIGLASYAAYRLTKRRTPA
ncbi:carbohydrate ABC transporter permease [Streptomyces formicae]|nr:sugar ABC transporter permease [Streptomyces formicae]